MGLNPQETMDLVTFTEEIINEKIDFLYGVFKAVEIYKNFIYGNKMTLKTRP